MFKIKQRQKGQRSLGNCKKEKEKVFSGGELNSFDNIATQSLAAN
jgi:hypothetical protein